MKINKENIAPGEEKTIHLEVAKLPTRTAIDIPVTVARSETPGPTLLVMGGLHGDEINGIEIIRRVLDNDLHIPKQGTVIAIPIINIFGFIHFSREVPDGKDVNRSFPGAKNGSLASKVAYTLMKEIVPHIDYCVDFHTGGDQRTNYPQIRTVLDDSENAQLAEHFHAPVTINSKLIEKSFRWAASAKGAKMLVYEGGESLRFDEFAIQEGINGLLRLMKALGMRDDAPAPVQPTTIIQSSKWLRASASGLWIPKINSGDAVIDGQKLGYIASPYGDFREPIHAKKGGVVFGLNNTPIVNRGDALVHLGFPG
ncbi:MAG: succinylglutamate desuccinylase/aspartoacylase family protein [Saprospiraceae bacterium]|nr:succinylglutamate desuccinylase/aspartoacylase family protein [Saprospiraceae bacterium]